MAGQPKQRTGIDAFGQLVADARRSLSPAARRVARFIDQNRLMVLAHSAADLATRIGTSDATVVRTVQALGFSGLEDLRDAMVRQMGGRSSPALQVR